MNTQSANFEPGAHMALPGQAPNEARCLRCGYLLCGLREARCPECGTDFDPGELSRGHPAQWPRLLVWTLAGIFIATLIKAPSLHAHFLWMKNTVGLDWPYRAEAIQCLLVATLGLAGLIGLIRRRDWGRKLLIAMLAFSVVITLTFQAVGYAAIEHWYRFQRARGAGLYAVSERASSHSSLHQIALLADLMDVIPWTAMLLFLLTGLRPHSLARKRGESPPLLPRNGYTARSDWLFLLMILLGCMVLRQASVAGFHIAAVIRAGSLSWVAASPFSELTVFLGVLAGPLAIICIWRDPRRVRWVAVPLIAFLALPVTVWQFRWLQRVWAGVVVTQGWKDLCGAIAAFLDWPLPALGTIVYLLFVLKRDEINQTAALREALPPVIRSARDTSKEKT